ncbi:MAG: hypothetical protein Q4B94_06260 [Pseudomonadota bacterium]|nr:hypothetical protein [Pseudomonadota bacterium]
MSQNLTIKSIRKTLDSLRKVRAQPALSAFISTHRTHPDNKRDPIALKNALSEAQTRIENEYDRHTAQAIMEKVDAALEGWDHNYNLDTLAIFATDSDAKVLRLPLDASERVVVDARFSTRDLLRELSHAVHYYAVVITRESARLIEAVNDRVVREFDADTPEQNTPKMLNTPFPMKNTLHSSSADRTAASSEDNHLKEFFNRVDKSVQELRSRAGEENLPLFVIGDNRNISFYQEVCDRPDIIAGSADKVTQLEDGSALHIIQSIQDEVGAYRSRQQQAAKEGISQARSQNRLLLDLQDIYRAAYQGAGDALYVRMGYMQPARVDETQQTLVAVDDPNGEGVNDDVVGDIIDLVKNNGGQVVFLPAEIIGEQQDIALSTRF